MVCADGLRVPRSARNAANHYGREMSVSVGGAPSAMESVDNDDYPCTPRKTLAASIIGSSSTHWNVTVMY
jgi:hypothetical protein